MHERRWWWSSRLSLRAPARPLFSLARSLFLPPHINKRTALILPLYSTASSTMMGAIMRQGPHQGAQKSTRTGTSALRTASSQVASVTGPAVKREREKEREGGRGTDGERMSQMRVGVERERGSSARPPRAREPRAHEVVVVVVPRGTGERAAGVEPRIGDWSQHTLGELLPAHWGVTGRPCVQTRRPQGLPGRPMRGD